MNANDRLCSMFLSDTYAMMRSENYNAVEAVARMRLYMTVSGYDKSLRELFSEGGFNSTDYDMLLKKYNKQLSVTF